MTEVHHRPTVDRERLRGHAVTFPPDWWSFAGAMGGVTAGSLLDAVELHLPAEWQTRTANLQFLSSVRESPLVIEVDVVRTGRSTTVLGVVARTEGRPAMLATVLAAPRDEELGTYSTTRMPVVPPPAECEEVELPRDLVPATEHLEFRFVGDARPTTGGSSAELTAWVRLRAPGPYGAGDLAVISDAMPPGLFGVAAAPVVMPTADLSLVFGQHAPAEGFVLVRMRTRHLDRAWAVDDCDVWSAEGSLLVQSRQSRRLLAPLER